MATTIPTLQSRYSWFNQSTVVDSKDSEVYPDPLSIDFSLVVYSEPPYQLPPDLRMQTRPYLYTYAFYYKGGDSTHVGLDDVILNMNNVPYITNITEKELIQFPVLADIKSYLDNAKKGVV